MGIHIALLIVSIDAKQWLQVGPRMDAAIQPPKPVLASMWEDDLVLEGALLTGQQRKYHAMVPCRAGVLSVVINANGDIGLCEQHRPIGNLRQKSFTEIWHSEQARQLRASINSKECYCTNEIFMWPSITYQPWYLARAMLGGKVWRDVEPLPLSERAPVSIGPDGYPLEHVSEDHDKLAALMASAASAQET